jgi:hypothetical protein
MFDWPARMKTLTGPLAGAAETGRVVGKSESRTAGRIPDRDFTRFVFMDLG